MDTILGYLVVSFGAAGTLGLLCLAVLLQTFEKPREATRALAWLGVAAIVTWVGYTMIR
jgi:hypothetical protein